MGSADARGATEDHRRFERQRADAYGADDEYGAILCDEKEQRRRGDGIESCDARQCSSVPRGNVHSLETDYDAGVAEERGAVFIYPVGLSEGKLSQALMVLDEEARHGPEDLSETYLRLVCREETLALPLSCTYFALIHKQRFGIEEISTHFSQVSVLCTILVY